MMRRLLVTLTVTAVASVIAVTAPVAADEGPVIRSITVRPGEPVVRASGSVRLLIDVVARGAYGTGGVTVSVEPGPPSAGAVAVGAPIAIPSVGRIGSGRAPARSSRRAFGWASERSSGRASGWETWRFHPETALSRWYPSGRWTVTATARNGLGATTIGYTSFYLRRATELEGVNVNPVDKGAEVTGTLLRVDPLGRVAYRPFAGQSVTIQVRPAEAEGSAEWRTLGTAVTGEDGWFTRHVRGKAGRVWRVNYAGSNHYAPDISAEKYITK